MTTAANKAILALSATMAVAVGWGLAQGDWVLPGCISVLAAGILLQRLSPFPAVSSATVTLVIGYIVGNRGFAQLSPLSSLPLFPAELGLAICAAVIFWEAARNRGSAFRFIAIDHLVVLWFVYGTVRLVPCVPRFGFLALRDYALVYYALFYFVGRYVQQRESAGDLIEKAVRFGSAIMLPLYILFELFPDFFLETMTVRGVPLIYYKGDLAGTFFVVGAIAWYFDYEGQERKPMSLIISLAQVGAVFATHNRASLLALAVLVGILAIRGHLRLLRALLFMGLAAAITVTLWVETGKNRWEDTPVPNLADRLASMVDIDGRTNNEDESKGDNNRFRTVWWQTVIQDTVAENPWLGLGYGADLTSHFLQIYYPDSSDEFTARSPHSFPLTVFARSGLAGLLLFTALAFWLAKNTVAALSVSVPQQEHPQSFSGSVPLLRFAGSVPARPLSGSVPLRQALPFCGATAIAISACFGVVLEGPMGAVLFWTFLGLGVNQPNPQENLDKNHAPA